MDLMNLTVAALLIVISSALAQQPPPDPSLTAPPTQPATTQPSASAEATRAYFNQVSDVLDRTLSEPAAQAQPSFYSDSAHKITTLPKENVDPDVIAWGGTVTLALTNAANELQTGREQAESRANGVPTPGVHDANDPNREQEAQVDQQNAQQARRQQALSEHAAASQRVAQLLANLQTSRTKVAEQLTQRYGK
jgi:hypothetical protein